MAKYVGIVGTYQGMQKLDLYFVPTWIELVDGKRQEREADLDALDVELSFGEHEDSKVSNLSDYLIPRMHPRSPHGVRLVRMGVDRLTIEITYWLSGDHTGERHTATTTVEMY